MTYNENKECKFCKWLKENFECIGIVLAIATFLLILFIGTCAVLDLVGIINVF